MEPEISTCYRAAKESREEKRIQFRIASGILKEIPLIVQILDPVPPCPTMHSRSSPHHTLQCVSSVPEMSPSLPEFPFDSGLGV